MTAKEMFEKLGYELDERCVNPCYWKTKPGGENQCIHFLGIVPYIHMYSYLDGEEEGTFLQHVVSIDCATLAAINQQCKELGWLKEE